MPLGYLNVKGGRRLVFEILRHWKPILGLVPARVRIDGSLTSSIATDDQSAARIPAVPNPCAERVAGLSLVRNIDLARRAAVHGTREAGVLLSVDQHPNDVHRRVQFHRHWFLRA